MFVQDNGYGVGQQTAQTAEYMAAYNQAAPDYSQYYGTQLVYTFLPQQQPLKTSCIYIS